LNQCLPTFISDVRKSDDIKRMENILYLNPSIFDFNVNAFFISIMATIMNFKVLNIENVTLAKL